MSTSALLATCSDFELIERFSESRDDDAFRALLERHGPMVQGVCERILGRQGLADDASQATFVLLARHADRLEVGMRSLAPWLHRVARNAATQALRSELARKRRERTLAEERDEMDTNPTPWQDAVPLLDEEIHRLPEQFRVVLILHYLQDRTQQDVANELGLSYGTLRRKLEQAKQMLRQRLLKRGVVVSTALLAQLLWDASASASVPHVSWSASAILSPEGMATQHLSSTAQALVNHGTRVLGRPQHLRTLVRATCVGAALCVLGGVVFRMIQTDPPVVPPSPVVAEPPVATQKPEGEVVANPVRNAEAPPLVPREVFAPNPVQNGTRAPMPIDTKVFRGEISVNGQNRAFDRPEAFEKALRQLNQPRLVDPGEEQPPAALPAEVPIDDPDEFHIAELIVNGKVLRFKTLREYEQAKERLTRSARP